MENLFNTGTEVKYEEKVIKIRRLGVIDVFKFAKLLGKVGTGTFSQLSKQVRLLEVQAGSEELTEEQRLAAQTARERAAQEMGFQMFASLAEYQDDLIDFLAGLTDLDANEFQYLPPDVAIEIIQAVATGEDMKRFFDKARALSTKLLPST